MTAGVDVVGYRFTQTGCSTATDMLPCFMISWYPWLAKYLKMNYYWFIILMPLSEIKKY